jgi:hypothetical protein
MTTDWRPADTEKRVHTQVAFDDERIGFRFRWEQPDPGGWIHDVLVYHEGEWRQFADPSPWASGDPDHTGFYEDRISFFLDDGSVRGFEEFGGWLTTHEGMRSLPSEVDPETVRADDHFGREGLDRTDVRKYLPQACGGEWWESDWRTVRPPAELARLKRAGVFLDLPMWRAHRSDPLGYGTDHHVLDYRHSDAGQNTYGTQAWDPVEGPEYMWDPDAVAEGALDYARLRAGEFPRQGTGTYALEPDDRVPFDPAVAEWEGATIPRRPLREPHGSAADWTATGTWADGEWTVEMWRTLRTDHPLDTTQLEPGGVYQWAPAIHHGAGKRWHWVGYPRRLGLGVDPDRPDGYPEPIRATGFAGAVDWADVPTHTQTLVFPGVQSWTALTSADHPQHERVRALETTMWQLHGRADR